MEIRILRLVSILFILESKLSHISADEKNAISGLTLEDIDNVQQSWSSVFADVTGNGFHIFFRLFEADPETKSFFKNIAHLEARSEITANVEFEGHVVNIMSAIDNTIKNLDQPELVVTWMEALGDMHRNVNVERKHFGVFKHVLVDILQNDLKLSNDVLTSWDRYIEFIYKPLLPRLAA